MGLKWLIGVDFVFLRLLPLVRGFRSDGGAAVASMALI